MQFTVKIISLICLSMFLIGCAQESGTLEFRANGEDFVRQGFISKDGWQIQFDTVNVTVSDVAAYRTEGNFAPVTGEMPDGPSVATNDVHTIDLAAGDTDAEPILVKAVDAEVGHYDAISWSMVNGEDGNTIRLIGSAEKDDQLVNFDIQIEETYAYACGEYVGDERTGFITDGSTDDVEMTFHFDHVFGDFDAPADDYINVGALGFAPLAALATDGMLSTTFGELSNQLTGDEFATLADKLATLGHVGEGHCYEATNGYTDSEG